VSLLIPYEWTYIPSSHPLREFIHNNKWSISIYRFKYQVFEDVQTTASISVIDKSNNDNIWKFFEVDESGKIKSVPSLTENGKPELEYEDRGRLWAMRGLSPGSKKIFTLTEKERFALNLTKKDVRPCITSLRDLPINIKILHWNNFDKYFIAKDKKCWLIRTDKKTTNSLKEYIGKIPAKRRNNWTCLKQRPWYRYRAHPVPKLLMSSAFKESGPRILMNRVKAIAFGSTIGIHTKIDLDIHRIQKKLREFDFNSRIISRDKGLKKIAIRQLNSVLNGMVEINNGKK
jgi:hypothetical protein